MARIAVAGAGGFIGSEVVERLRARGHQVLALDRVGADFAVAKAAGAQVAVADLADLAGTTALLQGCERAVNATGLFDLSAPLTTLRAANVEAADLFVQAAKEAGVVRVVHLSSVAVYGEPRLSPMPEEGPQEPRGAYEVSKQEGEAHALAHHGHGIEVTALRPTLVYGPRSRYGLALFLALASQARALGWKALPVALGGPRTHHVHVEDVAAAVELLLTAARAGGEAFNVADDTPLPAGDLMSAMAQAVGLKTLAVPGGGVAWPVAARLFGALPPSAIDGLNGWIDRGTEALRRRGLATVMPARIDRDWLGYFRREFVFDTAKLKRIGFAPAHPDVRTAIGGVVRWYREAGWLPSANLAKKGER